MSKKSIVPPTGEYNTWYSKFVLPQGLEGKVSAAGWTKGNEGFIQQTFLGASIRSFNVNAGFGDTSSTLSVELVNDEYNKSDNKGIGIGDDPYHNGQYDSFSPPPVGSPVFFKFGKNLADIEQAWRKTFDEIYGYQTLQRIQPKEKIFKSFENIPLYHFYDIEKSKQNDNLTFIDLSDYYDDVKNHPGRGANHFIFGGILQSTTQNKGFDGNPLFSVQIVDPKEILSNCQIILKNYAGSIFSNKNFFNVFGFLEHDISDDLRGFINSKRIPGFSTGSIPTAENWFTSFPFGGGKSDNNLEKIVDPATGAIYFYGNDVYRFSSPSFNFSTDPIWASPLPEFFPMTGQGFARVCDQGIPWYRVRQALEALMGYNGNLPQEYIDAGYGGPINFRGFNYIVDFSGIPLEKIPQMYFLDYEKIDLLSLTQELCETISHDMFISLLPVINHPACAFLYNYNNYWIKQALKFKEGSVERNLRLGKVISGIIRVDAINRSDAPSPGSIKAYLDNLTSQGVPIKNQDLGYELSNVETDKIVVGAQEVNMYFFNTSKDKDNMQVRRRNAGLDNKSEYLMGEQWSLSTMLKQQILPFYGFLGKDAVTIPRGFGAYQQIMLDATGLDAYGVGSYYIATEMELRAALISYEKWKNFLLQYNNTYIEELTGNQQIMYGLASKITEIAEGLEDFETKYGEKAIWVNGTFGVSVPRCVFNSDKNGMGEDGFPLSRCAPPYGYPLYYQRATAIGIPETGPIGTKAAFEYMRLNFYNAQNTTTKFQTIIDNKIAELDAALDKLAKNEDNDNQKVAKKAALTAKIQSEIARLQEVRNSNINQEGFAEIENFIKDNVGLYRNLQMFSKRGQKNAKVVYDFVRNIAEKHLGKTFLVKIPKACNVYYSDSIELWNNDPTFNIKRGPFGFKPQSINSNIGYYVNNEIENDPDILRIQSTVNEADIFEHYIYHPLNYYYTTGALKNNFNPISDKWEFNYEPEPQGGFFNYNFNGGFNLLIPQDITNFVEQNRFQCYVRFNDSQNLDFSQVPKDSFLQQAYTPDGFIPDILEELENVAHDSNSAFNEQGDLFSRGSQRTVAFVKCTIDPKFYMAPRVVSNTTKVWARKVRFMPNSAPLQITKKTNVNGQPQTEEGSRRYQWTSNPNRGPVNENGEPVKVTQEEISTIPYQSPIFWIKNGGSDGAEVQNTDFLRYYDSYTNSYLVDTQNLDPDHVYAIITLPSKIGTNTQTRYADSIMTAYNASTFKNLMTVDVVKGVPGFEKPPVKQGKKEAIDISNISESGQKQAFEIYQTTLNGMKISRSHTQISYASPSPVYPDLVVLPLMSKERCYGPWISTSVLNSAGDVRLRYSDIGGKVEFVKDENLAPWNYNGYQLMNEAGSLQAQFSNSLLLYSERGGFVIPDAPLGISLAKALQVGGPLVTSISVDITNSEVSTTIKMDLYTSKFGKLQKQKEKAIGFINRERQKIMDKTNADIRRGMGKNRSNASITQILLNAGGGFLQNKLNNLSPIANKALGDLEKGVEPANNLIIEINQLEQEQRQIGTPDTTATTNQVSFNGAIMPDSNLIDIQAMQPDQQSLVATNNNAASINFGDQFAVVPQSHHPILRSMQDNADVGLIEERNQGYEFLT